MHGDCRPGKHAGSFQLGEITPEAEQLRNDFKAQPDALLVDLAGSYRRCERNCARPRFHRRHQRAGRAHEIFRCPSAGGIGYCPGTDEIERAVRSGIQCDLRVVSREEYPFALNYFTGSKEHNIEMRNRALKRGWTLNEYRLAPLPPDPAKQSKTRR